VRIAQSISPRGPATKPSSEIDILRISVPTRVLSL
jgi:hypothetical protein